MVTRQNFDLELDTLREKLQRMGMMVNTAIKEAVESLTKQDLDLADQVISGDDLIDDLEEEIEEKCMVLIARQQPLARDLRIISTGLKIAIDLERMADHACNIAKVTHRIANQPLIKPLVDVPRMATLVQQMINESLESYFKLDVSLAEKVCAADDDIDNLYQQVFRELLTFMFEDPRTINQATQLIFVGRFLERVGDHCTNIAESTIFLVTGQRIRKN